MAKYDTLRTGLRQQTEPDSEPVEAEKTEGSLDDRRRSLYWQRRRVAVMRKLGVALKKAGPYLAVAAAVLVLRRAPKPWWWRILKR